MFENYEAPSELKPSDPRFGCGPSLVPVDYLKSLANTGVELMGTSHRKPAVKNLVRDVQEGVSRYFGLPDDYTVAMGNGGATLLFDMMGLGMVEKRSAHFTCGEFSEKWFKSHNSIPWIEAEKHGVEFGKGVTASNIDGADFIATTLNETSTGVMFNSLPTVGDDTILAVDATSGGAQCPCDVTKTDTYFFSPQKVFASDGGLFVSCMSPKAKERALKIAADTSRYVPGIMDWKTCLDNSDKNQTYNTPAIATLWMLNEQLKVMNEVGYKAVQENGRRKADHVYNWANEKPYLSCFIEEEQYRSTAVATINLDEKISAPDLCKRLHDLGYVYGIESYRKLGKNQFRIALFYNISEEDIQKLTQLLSHAIESEL